MIESFSYDTRSMSAGIGASAVNTYDATDDRGRRRSPPSTTSSEDWHANDRRRRILSSSTRDLCRNLVIAAWAIRKHLDYVADFTFQGATPDSGYNKYLVEVWKELTTRYRFDAAARHPHRRAVRLLEAGKCVDGDQMWMKLAPAVGNPLRGTVQAIEGDRIWMPRGSVPPNSDPNAWINGLLIDLSTARALAVGICRRVGPTRKELQAIKPYRNMIHHAAYEFRVDQVRGISPIASALNWFRDMYEGFEFALAKVKVAQLFGLAIKTNDATSSIPPNRDGSASDEDCDDDDDSSKERQELASRMTKGPFVADLDVGEEAQIIEAKNPSTETVDFLKLMIHISLRCLDIPFSFFDESFTNFYGSRGGLVQYLHSCNQKVQDLQETLGEHADWRLGLAVADGEVDLPSGKDFDYIRYEFVPGGVPWWDTTKEVRGAGMAVAIGQTSPQRICRETGTDFYKNIDETSEALEYARQKGVDLKFADSSAFAPEITVQGSSNDN